MKIGLPVLYWDGARQCRDGLCIDVRGNGVIDRVLVDETPGVVRSVLNVQHGSKCDWGGNVETSKSRNVETNAPPVLHGHFWGDPNNDSIELLAHARAVLAANVETSKSQNVETNGDSSFIGADGKPMPAGTLIGVKGETNGESTADTAVAHGGNVETSKRRNVETNEQATAETAVPHTARNE